MDEHAADTAEGGCAVSENLDADIKMLYSRGWDAMRIAKLEGIDHLTVYARLRAMGVEIRKQKAPAPAFNKYKGNPK